MGDNADGGKHGGENHGRGPLGLLASQPDMVMADKKKKTTVVIDVAGWRAGWQTAGQHKTSGPWDWCDQGLQLCLDEVTVVV